MRKPEQCNECKKWFVDDPARKDQWCLAIHLDDSCCHLNETEVNSKQTLDDELDEILHNLWINAELFQHQVEKNDAIDMRRPDQYKAKAKARLLQWGTRQRIDEIREFAGYEDDEWKSIAQIPQQRFIERIAQLQASLKESEDKE